MHVLFCAIRLIYLIGRKSLNFEKECYISATDILNVPLAAVSCYIVDLSFALMIGFWVLSTGSARVIEESNLSSIYAFFVTNQMKF